MIVILMFVLEPFLHQGVNFVVAAGIAGGGALAVGIVHQWRVPVQLIEPLLIVCMSAGIIIGIWVSVHY